MGWNESGRVKAQRWTLSTFYHASWVLLLSEAALLSWQSELTPLPLLVVSFVFSLWCLVPSGRFRRVPVFSLWGRLFSMAALAFVIGQQHLRSPDLASLLGTLLWASLFLFLPRKQKHLGHWIGILVTGLIALMCVIVKQEFYTHVVFLGFLLTLVFTLNANNLYSLAGAAGAIRYRLSVSYFRQLTPALMWGLFGGGLVFFFFPRTQLFSNPWGLKERESKTGYTGQIKLQTANAISEDTTVALTIESDPVWLVENAHTLYLRGNTVETFDGTQWISAETERWPYRYGEDVRYSMIPSHWRLPARIYREPHSTRAILYPGVLLHFRGPEALLGGTRFDRARSLYRSASGSLRYAYDVVIGEEPSLESLDPAMTVEQLSSQWARERAKAENDPSSVAPSLRYTYVPESIEQSGYFRNWKKEVLGAKPPQTAAKILSALSLNFIRKFVPTLVHETKASSVLEGFLTTDRTGHCEYFATAATLFLRSQGIPSRVVLGYRGGSFNSVSHTLEVRERNAHAWVEIYGGRGVWYRYDPTPALPLGDDTGMVAQAANYYNAVKFWFNRYVVLYDSSTQQQVWMQVSLLRGKTFNGLPKWQALLDMFRWLGLAVAIWLIPRFLRRRQRNALEMLPAYYRIFLRRLERAGWWREPGETFARFHERLQVEGWDAFSVGRLDEAIQRDLYSPRPLPSEEATRLRKWVAELPIQKKVAAPRQSK